MNGSITFTSGVAINKDNFYMASTFDELDHWDYFSRMFIYRHNDEENWSYHNLDGWGLVSTAFKKDPRELLTLNCNGDIETYTAEKEIYTNVVPQRKENLIYEAFTCIRNLGFATYVCGNGGRVYKANQNNIWEDISGNLAEPLTDTAKIIKEDLLNLDKEYGYSTSFYSIFGFSSNELYVCGSKKGRGFLAFFNGEFWSEIDIKTPSTLHSITASISQEDIIIVGKYGTLLRGNIHSGFKNLKDMGVTSTFYSSDFYNNILYIASHDGLYTYDNNIFKKVKEVEHVKATFYVEEKDGVLWVLAEKALIRFDGEHWEIIKHPYNMNNKESDRIKCYAGDRCPESGDWYSPHQVEKRYFAKGDVMPEIENNTWGETIWYLDI